MDISSINFQNQLPYILEAIATAHFVALDLELSGIPGQQPNRWKAEAEHSGGKPTLQQRYEETKIAAERYQVLQCGITCVREDKERGVYITQPFNIFVNPVPDGRLDVERIFSFQSGAVEFLLGHRFRLEAPFIEGVPYYSRKEEALARQIAFARWNRNRITSIEIAEGDQESLDFVQRTRLEISAWKDLPEPKQDYLNIAPVGHSSPQFRERGLNNFQKRLVHQLVQAEYPELRTLSRQGFIQIIAYDKKREDAVQKEKVELFEERLRKQVGLRWLVEAMVRGSLGAVESWQTNSTIEKAKPRFVGLVDRLKKKQTVLAGHNVFIDLIYFYACFFGELPARVEHFLDIMHQFFPLIVDTKYLATYSHSNPAFSKSSLQDLDEELLKLQKPIIDTHSEHSKYDSNRPNHEAGFDSYMTAKVLIRLAAKLASATTAKGKENTNLSETVTTHQVNQDEDGSSQPLDQSRKTCGSDSDSGGVPLSSAELETLSPNHRRKSRRTTKPADRSVPTTIFVHPSQYDILKELSSDEDLIDLKEPKAGSRKKQKAKKKDKNSTQPFVMMPAFDHEFWKVHGNRLRVNGTVEGVCHIQPLSPA